jgi:hypothetical protein
VLRCIWKNGASILVRLIDGIADMGLEKAKSGDENGGGEGEDGKSLYH